MPANHLALELLEETGPLAVSSANLTGKAAAITASDAQDMLGDSVAVYLDGGPSATGVASTIIDATSLVDRCRRRSSACCATARSTARRCARCSATCSNPIRCGTDRSQPEPAGAEPG